MSCIISSWIRMWVHIFPSGSRCGSTWVTLSLPRSAMRVHTWVASSLSVSKSGYTWVVLTSLDSDEDPHEVAWSLPGNGCGSMWRVFHVFGFFSCWIQMWIHIICIRSSWFLMWWHILHSKSRCGSPQVASSLPGSWYGSAWGIFSVAGAFPLAGFRCGSHYNFLAPDEDPREAHSPLWIQIWIYSSRIISSWFRMWIHVRCFICCWRFFSSRWIQMWIHVITESHHLYLNSYFSPTWVTLTHLNPDEHPNRV